MTNRMGLRGAGIAVALSLAVVIANIKAHSPAASIEVSADDIVVHPQNANDVGREVRLAPAVGQAAGDLEGPDRALRRGKPRERLRERDKCGSSAGPLEERR